jgi:hypothetical protein
VRLLAQGVLLGLRHCREQWRASFVARILESGGRFGQRWTVKIQRLEDYPRAAGRLDTSWALKFNGLKFDADLDAAAVCSIHEKADSSQAS